MDQIENLLFYKTNVLSIQIENTHTNIVHFLKGHSDLKMVDMKLV